MTVRARLLLAVGCAVAAALALLAGGAFSRQQINVVTALQGCVPQEFTSIAQYDQQVACIDAVLKKGIDQDGVLAVHRELRQASEAQPALLRTCHVPAHTAGRYAHASGEDLPAFIAGALEESCFTGLLHGMLEDWAAGKPGREELQSVISACETAAAASSDQSVAGRCSESVGHAVWTVWGTAEPCASFRTPDDQAQCGSGVVMQSYWPVGSDTPVDGKTEDDVMRMCREWPAMLDPQGCWFGAAYALQYGLSHALEEAYAENLSETQALPKVTQAARHQAERCRELTGPQRQCEQNLLNYLPSRLQQWPTVAAAVCETFRDPETQACRVRLGLQK